MSHPGSNPGMTTLPTYESSRQPGRVLVPFSLRLTPPVRLLLLSLADDPVYTDLEVQWVDDPQWGGAGAVLLAVRHDGTADVHVDERLDVAREDYEIGAGVAGFATMPMSPCRFDISDRGAQVELGLSLADGRPLRLSVHEARRTPRPLVRMLAPAGHAMTKPRFFPFFWMDDIWFLRWRGARVQVRIGDEVRRVVRVGAPWRLARYATAPMTALWCESGTTSVRSVPDSPGRHALDATPATGAAASTARVVEDGGQAALLSVSVQRGSQSLEIRFDPPFPDIIRARSSPWEGRWTALASGRAQFGGRWYAIPQGDQVELAQAVDRPWDPGPQPLVGSLVFRLLRVFRTWPTTYRWHATLDVDADPPTMSGEWTRTAV